MTKTNLVAVANEVAKIRSRQGNLLWLQAETNRLRRRRAELERQRAEVVMPPTTSSKSRIAQAAAKRATQFLFEQLCHSHPELEIGTIERAELTGSVAADIFRALLEADEQNETVRGIL